jgi:hypothetical protein
MGGAQEGRIMSTNKLAFLGGTMILLRRHLSLHATWLALGCGATRGRRETVYSELSLKASLDRLFMPFFWSYADTFIPGPTLLPTLALALLTCQ